jgi:transposase
MVDLDKDTRLSLKRIQKNAVDRTIYIKLTVILMLDRGVQTETIADDLGIDLSTLFRYQADYLTLKLEDYLKADYLAYTGRLTAEQETILVAELQSQLYLTIQAIRQFILVKFGINYTLQGVTALVHRLGFVYKKTTLVLSKADAKAQQAFLDKLTRLFKSLKPDDALYFNDAVHPQHYTRAEWGWIMKGQTFPMASNTERERINLNGH